MPENKQVKSDISTSRQRLLATKKRNEATLTCVLKTVVYTQNTKYETR